MQAVRICNELGNKYTGFELAKNETLIKIFPNGAHVGLKFKIGNYDYEVVDIHVDGFYTTQMDRSEFTIDDDHSTLGTHLWICCRTNDPRMKEGGFYENSSGIEADLGL